MNKRGIIKLGAGIFILLLVLVLVFSLFFSSASQSDSYSLGQEVKIDLSKYMPCTLKVRTPSTNLVQSNCEDKFSLKFDELGEYVINIKSQDSLERLAFQVNLNKENYTLFDFKNNNVYTLWNTLKFDFENLGNYELIILTPSGKRISRVASNDMFFFELIEEGKYSVSFERGNGITSYEFFVVSKNKDNLIQEKAEINKPVGWNKAIEGINTNNLIEVPKTISLDLKKENGEKFTNYEIVDIGGKNYIQFTENLSENINLEYSTEPPKVEEKTISDNKKEVVVYSPPDMHYENVLSYTELPREIADKNLIKVYWREENTYLNFEAKDTSGNGLLDYVEWTVPHLSNQTFDIILITKAEHLSSNRTFISDIYEQVKSLDNIWSEVIPENDYVRVTFEIPLDNTRDITIFPRITSGNPTIEVYEEDGTEKIAEFNPLLSNEYNKILLTNLNNSQETFDLKVVGGSLEFDYIVDPSLVYDFNDRTNNLAYNYTAGSAGDRLTLGSLLNTAGYNNLVSLDNNNATATSAGQNDYVLLRFTFDVNESRKIVNWVNITINGGETCAGTVQALVRNWTGNSWTSIANVPATKGAITLNFSGINVVNHLGANGNVTIVIDDTTDMNCDTGDQTMIDYIKLDVTYTPDTIPPVYNLVSVNNTAYGQISKFAINVSDNADLNPNGGYIFSTNNTGTWVNDSFVLFSTTPSWANVTKILNSTFGTIIGYRWFFNDSYSTPNYNSTPIYVLTTTDGTPPIFTAIPANSSLFYANESLLVKFVGTDAVGFGYYKINDTRFSINQTGFLSNVTPMAAGNYEINVTINDTSNNINWTRYKVQINKSNYYTCGVYFNTTSPINYPSNFIVYTNCSTAYTLYRNSTAISNGTVINAGAGYYNLTVQRTDTTNYTNVFSSSFFTVNENPENCQVLYNATSPITYPETFTTWANCTTPFTLYRNGTAIGNNSVVNGGAGAYNISFIRTDSQNYSIYFNQSQFIVNKDPSYTCGVYFNTTSPITYPDNFITYTNCSTAYTLYRNGTSIGNASTINGGASYYNLTVRRTDTANYTNVFSSSFFTVNKNPENCQVLFNTTSPIDYPDTFLVWANCTTPFVLARNGTTISNYTEQALAASAYNFSLRRNDTANYSIIFNQSQFRINGETIPPYFITIPDNSSLFYGNESLGVYFNATDNISFGYYRVNDTRFSINQSGFLRNATPMAVGNYAINVTINDTSNNINWTIYKVQINKSNYYNCGVYFNATSPIYFPDTFRVYTNCSSAYTLYRNGSAIANNSIVNSGAGYYNLTVQRTDTTNYTYTSKSEFFTVNKNPENCQVLFSSNSPLNYPQVFQVWANCTTPFILRRNETTNSTIANNSLQALEVGTYNFSFSRFNTANYSITYNETSFTILPFSNDYIAVYNVNSSMDVVWGQPTGINRWLAGTNLTDSQYANVSTDNGAYVGVTSLTANDRPFFRYNFTINEPPSTISWIDIIYSGYDNATSAGDVGNVYVWNFSSAAWITLGTTPATDSNVSRNITTGFNTLLDSNGRLVVVSEGSNFDVGDMMLVDYIRVMVGHTPDNTPPTYNKVSINNTLAGQITKFSINVSDNLVLHPKGGYIFSTNNTGDWVNDSFVLFTTTPSWANVTKTLNSTVGTIVGYMWYFNDTSGNTNSTNVYTVEALSDTFPPLIKIVYPISGTYDINVSALNYTYYDANPGYCWYSNNGGAINSTPIAAGENFTDLVADFGSNTWIVFCNDSGGYENNSRVTFFQDEIKPLKSITIEDVTTNTNSGTSIAIARPTNVRNGDVLVGYVSKDDAPVITGPAGWTQILQYNTAAPNGLSNGAWYKIIYNLSSEPASYSWTGDNEQWSGGIMVLRGVNLTNVLDVPAVNNTGVSNNPTTPSITTVTDLDLILSCASLTLAGNTVTSSTEPAGTTPQIQSYIQEATSLCANYTQSPPGATGTKQWTTDGDPASIFHAHQIAFRPGKNVLPTGNLTINSTNGRNESDSDLNCYAQINDSNYDLINISLIWYKNNVPNLSIDYNNSYSPGTNFTSVLKNTNLTVWDNWSCSIRLYDGQQITNWTNTSNLMIKPDSTPPAINVTYPLNNQIYNINVSQLNYTVYDFNGVSYCWYSTNNGTTNSTLVAPNTNFTSVISIEGTNFWRVYCNDTNGNIGNNVSIFAKDLTAPNATLLSPENDSTKGPTNNFTVNVTDNVNLKNATLFIFNSTGFLVNQTTRVISGVTVVVGVVVTLAEGVYKWFYKVFDSAGYSYNTENNTVTIDTLKPNVTITYPQNTFYLINVSALNYTYYDDNPGYCWYSKNNGTTNLSVISAGTNFTDVVSIEGTNFWTVYCNDSSGNINSSRINFTKNTLPPSINRIFPQNTSYNINISSFNYTAIDASGVDRCWFTNNSGATNSTLVSAGTNFTNLISFEGSNTWTIYCNDTSNYENSSTVTFFKDTEVPVFTNISITNKSGINGGVVAIGDNVTINATVFDSLGLDKVFSVIWQNSIGSSVIWQGFLNIITGNFWSTSSLTNVSTPLGLVNYTVYANDSGSNLVNISGNFTTIDIILPIVNLTSPVNGDFIGVNESIQSFVASFSDNYRLQNSTFHLWNSSGFLVNQTTRNITGVLNSTNLTVNLTYPGIYSWNYFVCDYAGNCNWNSTNYTIIYYTFIPQVQIVYPINLQNYNINVSQLNYTYNDTNPGYCWYSKNNGTTNLSVVSAGNNFTNVFSAEGTNYWTVYCNNTAGNVNSSRINFYKDTIVPLINIAYPINTSYNFNITALNYTYSDASSGQCWYSNDSGVTNSTLVNAGDNFTSLFVSEGQNNWTVYCNDSLGNFNLTRVRFTIDLTLPNATLIFPFNDTLNKTATQNMTVNLTDNINLKNATLFIFNSTGDKINETNRNVSGIQATIGVIYQFLSDGIFKWFYRAFDLSGNSFSTENNTITIDTTKPVINITSPTNNILYTVNISTIDYTYSDLHSDSCWYSNSSGTWNSTKVSAGTNFTDVITKEGANNFTVYCNDSAGNINFSTVNFVRDLLYPLLNITYPLNINYSTNVSTLNYTYFDANPGYCWYSTNWGSINSTLVSAGNNFTNIFSVEGLNNWTIYCNDSSGKMNVSQTIFFKDSIYPLIQFELPTILNNSNLSQNWIYVNVSVNETNEINISFNLYNLSGLVNITTLSAGSRSLNWTNLSDAIYFYNVTVFDIASNKNSTETRRILLDTHNPNATLLTPLNNTITSNTTLNLTVNLTDNIRLSNATLYVYNSTDNLINQTTLEVSGIQATIGVIYQFLSDGIFKWFYKVFDLPGNSFSSENNTLMIDTAYPSLLIVYPQNINYTINVSNINYTYFDYNPGYCWYSKNNGTTNSTKVNAGNNFTNVVSVEGTNYWTVYCNDSAGNLNISQIIFFKDSIKPFMNITYPLNLNYSTNVSQLNYTYLDANPGYCWYSNNSGTTNSTIFNAGTNFTNLISFEGSNSWEIYCNDSLDNENLSRMTFFKDTIFPLIQFEQGTSDNDTIAYQNWIYVNVSVDELNEANVTFRLYNTTNGLTLVNTSTRTNKVRTINWTNLSPGVYYYNVTVIDVANNQNTTETRKFTYGIPDFFINSSEIYSNESIVRENQSIEITATIYNLGNVDINNVTVRFYNGNPDAGGTKIGTDIFINISKFNQTNVTKIWSAQIGISQIFVLVDPPLATNGSFIELNESNNRGSKNFSVDSWQFFYGGVLSLSDSVLANSNLSKIIDWDGEGVAGGNIYVTDSNSYISWNNLQAIGKTKTNTSSSSDFAEIDSALNSTSYSDSVYSVYTNSGTIKYRLNLQSFGKNIQDVPIFNSTNNSNFLTGILWDTSDDVVDGEFDSSDKEDLVFVAPMNKQAEGTYGTYDYEMRVPAKLRGYHVGSSKAAVFYVELF